MPLTIEEKDYNIKKSTRISRWKTYGIIDEDLSAVYEYYIKETHCMVCFKPYKDSKDRHLDHDHETGEIRYICCQSCNTHFLREKPHVITKPRSDTNSGHLSIYYRENEDKWIFQKQIYKKRFFKRFDTLAEAIQWKIDNNYP